MAETEPQRFQPGDRVLVATSGDHVTVVSARHSKLEGWIYVLDYDGGRTTVRESYLRPADTPVGLRSS